MKKLDAIYEQDYNLGVLIGGDPMETSYTELVVLYGNGDLL